MTQRIAITGAAGFIGAHATRAFLAAGWEVVGIDNFDPFYDRRIKEDGIADFRDDAHFTLHEADIREPAAAERAVADVDVVLHLAARAGVRPSIEDPALYTSVNVDGTTVLLEACRRAGVRRVVFGSSSSVYGDTTPAPFREDAAAVDPISPYAATKRAGELLCRVFTHLHGFRIAALRFFTVYGPRQRPDLAIHKFTRLLDAGQPIPQFGDGGSERDYTHIEDIVQGIMGSAHWVGDGDAGAYEVFNLGEAQTVRLRDLIRLIAAALGTEPRVEILPEVPGDVRRTCADITKARATLGYNPRRTIEQGIPEFVSWYRSMNGRSA